MSETTPILEVKAIAKRFARQPDLAEKIVMKFGADLDFREVHAVDGVDLAEICIASDIRVTPGEGPPEAFRLPEAPGVAVVTQRAPGVKCARSWKYFDPATADPDYPEVTPRDAQALRELVALGRWSGAGS